MVKSTTPFIGDDQELVSATHNGYPLKVCDDAFGPLYLYIESHGPVGLIRTIDWYSAYDLVLDEILTPIKPDRVPEAYGFDCPRDFELACQTTIDGYPDRELAEGYHYQSNMTGTGIVASDPEYATLNQLTPGLVDIHNIEIQLEDL